MTTATRPGAGDGTTPNCMVNERKGEHSREEGRHCSRGQEADGGRSALASSAGERDDREGGATSLGPASAAGQTTALIEAGGGQATTRRRAGGGQRCARTEVVIRQQQLAATRAVCGRRED